MLTRCSSVVLRGATPHDDAYQRRLFAESRDDLAMLPQGIRDSLIDMQFRAQAMQLARNHPDADRRVLVADGVDAGVLVLDDAADALRIVDLTVERRERRRGIAGAAVTAVIAAAGERPVRLSVWSTNEIARALYERLGFIASAGADVEEGYITMERRAG